MESLARAFDEPIDSIEHQNLAENVWVGGGSVTVRYWLGRLLNCNLFRETDDTVASRLHHYLVTRGCHVAASLVADRQCWGPITILLRSDFESASGVALTGNVRCIGALRALVANPELTNAELADRANTTEKQVARMTDVTLIRKAWRLRQADRPSKEATVGL